MVLHLQTTGQSSRKGLALYDRCLQTLARYVFTAMTACRSSKIRWAATANRWRSPSIHSFAEQDPTALLSPGGGVVLHLQTSGQSSRKGLALLPPCA